MSDTFVVEAELRSDEGKSMTILNLLLKPLICSQNNGKKKMKKLMKVLPLSVLLFSGSALAAPEDYTAPEAETLKFYKTIFSKKINLIIS